MSSHHLGGRALVLAVTLVAAPVASISQAAATTGDAHLMSSRVAQARVFSGLYGVSADSPTDAWAVGDYQKPTGGPVKTLILHWDGTTWSRVASPTPGGITDHLRSVSAVSTTNARTVGAWASGPARTLNRHWVVRNGVEVPIRK